MKGQRHAEWLDDANRPDHEAVELGEDRSVPFRLIVLLVSRPRHLDKPDLLEARELSVDGASSPRARRLSSALWKRRSGWPKSKARTRCCTGVKRASARLDGRRVHVPFRVDHTRNGDERSLTVASCSNARVNATGRPTFEGYGGRLSTHQPTRWALESP